MAVPSQTQALAVTVPEPRTKARQRLRRKLAGDLDMIVLMALRKEPHRRYLSAEQFSEDLSRYLDGRPVIARRDTFGYRTAKLIRRNPATVVAGGLLTLAFIGGSLVSIYNARNAQQRLAQTETQVESARADALRKQHDLLSTYFRLAQIQTTALKDTSAALATYRLALSEARTLIRSSPQDEDGRRSVAQAAVRVAGLAPSEALDLYGEALPMFEALLQSRPDDDTLRQEAVSAGQKLGLAQYARGNLRGALATFTAAEKMAESPRTDLQSKHALAAANFSLGEVLIRTGDQPSGIARLSRALDLYKEFTGTSALPAGNTPEAFEHALSQLAASAPRELRDSISADLAPFVNR